jgi:Zn-dependent protease
MSHSARLGTNEQIDLLLSWMVLVIGFSIADMRSIPGVDAILVSAQGVGTGFLLHELAHKFVAQHYGYLAEYRANRGGLLFIVIMSFMGFIFAAPGAVMIHKVPNVASSYEGGAYGKLLEKKSRQEVLWIALAGPITNIILMALFFALLSSGLAASRLATNAIYFAFFINLNLAAFNLIPFGPLDGRKIFEINRLAWAIIAIPTILIAMLILFGIRII